jgi:hypothetical protein
VWLYFRFSPSFRDIEELMSLGSGPSFAAAELNLELPSWWERCTFILAG